MRRNGEPGRGSLGGAPLLALYAVGIALAAAELGTMLEDPQGGLRVFVVMLMAAWWLVGLLFALLRASGCSGGRSGRPAPAVVGLVFTVVWAASLVLVTVWLYLPGA